MTRPSGFWARRGFAIPEEALERDFKEPYTAFDAVETAWARIYANADEYWDLYELAEKLVDLEYHFQLWRFGHLKTVERGDRLQDRHWRHGWSGLSGPGAGRSFFFLSFSTSGQGYDPHRRLT